jgi:autotransporter-associated beta strand protein
VVLIAASDSPTARAAELYWAGTGTANWATASAWSATEGAAGSLNWAAGDSAFFTNNTPNTQVRITSAVSIGRVTSTATTNGGWVTLYSTNTNAAFTGSGGFTGDFRLYTNGSSVDVSFAHSGGFNGTLALGQSSTGAASAGPVVFEHAGATSVSTKILMNSSLARMSLHNAYANGTMTIGELGGNQSGAVITTSGTLSLGTRTLAVDQSTSTSFAGLLTEAGPTTPLALSKRGAGTLSLSQANTYTGPTTITGGTLALSGSGSIAGSSSIQIGAAAKLDVSGLTAGSFSVPSTGLAFELPMTGAAGLLDATGKTLDLNTASVTFSHTSLNEMVYVLANYGTLSGAFATPAPTGYQYDYTYNGGTAVALVVVPEPGALILLGTSLPTLLWWVWRRRR